MRVVSASANAHKVEEMSAVLSTLGIELLPRPADVPDVVEDAETLEGNARLKAVAISEATSDAALADDTGLEVDALAGAPGVRSARYAGEGASDDDNVDRLLSELARVGADDASSRRARFRTVIVLHRCDGSEVVAEGVVFGRIATERSGSAGFGYDPVFIPDDGDGRTFAEMSADEKNAISHRARALRSFAASL